tara:strand:- start:2379 stop:7025 length:4647 start_codon:yes stop_codon:yes gene_type:complete
MAKEKFEITHFGGIDRSVSQEDTEITSSINSLNIDTQKSGGRIKTIRGDEVLHRDGFKPEQENSDSDIVFNNDLAALNMATLDNEGKVDLVIANGKQGIPMEVIAFKDIYSEYVTDVSLADTDVVIPEDSSYSTDTPAILESQINSTSGIASIEKWNNSLHIGTGGGWEDVPKWVGRPKGGFLSNSDTEYEELACKDAYQVQHFGSRFTKVVTDCYSTLGFRTSQHDDDSNNEHWSKELRCGKYAYCYNYEGSFIYKYDLDPDTDGNIGKATLVQQSPRFDRIVALTYDPNGHLANQSLSPEANESVIRETDGVVIIVDSGDSDIDNFGGTLILMRASDLKVIATYPIKYPDTSDDLTWDSIHGMNRYQLGIDYESDYSQWYKGCRGDGIGDIAITNAMEHLQTNDETYPARTLWISISGNHRIGQSSIKNVGTDASLWGNLHNEGRDSWRMLWSFNGFEDGWPTPLTPIEFVNASPPCTAEGGGPGSYLVGLSYDDKYDYYHGNSSFSTSGFYMVPKNALAVSKPDTDNKEWITLTCTMGRSKMDSPWLVPQRQTDFGGLLDGELNPVASGYPWPWGSPQPDIPLISDESNDSQFGGEDWTHGAPGRPEYSQGPYPMIISTVRDTSDEDGHYLRGIRIAVLSIHHHRDITRNNSAGSESPKILYGLGANGTNGLVNASDWTTAAVNNSYATMSNSATTFRTYLDGDSGLATTSISPDAASVPAADAGLRSTCAIQTLVQSDITSLHLMGNSEDDDLKNDDLLAADTAAHFKMLPGMNTPEETLNPIIGVCNFKTLQGVHDLNRRYVILKAKDGTTNSSPINSAYVAVFDSRSPLDSSIADVAHSSGTTLDKDLIELRFDRSQYTGANSLKGGWYNSSFAPVRTYDGAVERSYPSYNNDGDITISYNEMALETDSFYKLAQLILWSPSISNLTSGYTSIYGATNPNTDNGLGVDNLEQEDINTTTGLNYRQMYRHESIVNDYDSVMINVVNGDSGNNFTSGKKYKYQISYTMDGFQETALQEGFISDTTTDVDSKEITLKIRCFDNTMRMANPRYTHINIYRTTFSATMKQESEAELVKSLELSEEYFPGEFEDIGTNRLFFRVKTISDKRNIGASYAAINGVPETLKNLGLHYALNTTIGSYHFVARCYIPETGETVEHGLFRSQPAKFDTFDWSNDYILLPEIPNAIKGFRGRLYAFSDSTMYVISPSTLEILDTYEGIGCWGPNAITISDEYGMLFANKQSIYLHNGSSVKNIGVEISNASKVPQAFESSADRYIGWEHMFSSSALLAAAEHGDGINPDASFGNRLSERFKFLRLHYLQHKDVFIMNMYHPGPNNMHGAGQHDWLVDPGQIAEEPEESDTRSLPDPTPYCFAYSPKQNRWEKWWNSGMRAGCPGKRSDFLFQSTQMKTQAMDFTDFWYNFYYPKTSIKRYLSADKNPVSHYRVGYWTSGFLTLGSSTQYKVLSKLRITSNNLQIFGANLINVRLKTEESGDVDLVKIEEESTPTMDVYRIGGPSKVKCRWVMVELIGISPGYESLSITFKRKRMN